MSEENITERVAVDYFTVTAKAADAAGIYAQARKIAATLDCNLKAKPWRFFGYEGFIYSHSQVGHFAYGESTNDLMGVIAQASGELASLYIISFLAPTNRFSRVDLCVDVRLPVENPGLCEAFYRGLQKQENDRKFSLVLNAEGGQTLYIGSRRSDQFGRLYDKGVEAGLDCAGCVYRYEIELKRKVAKSAVLEIASRMSQDVPIGAINTTVYDWFRSRGVQPLFTRGNVNGLEIRGEFCAPTDDTRLAWIRKQVSPSVRRMLADGNKEVLEALGVTDFYRLAAKEQWRRDKAN